MRWTTAAAACSASNNNQTTTTTWKKKRQPLHLEPHRRGKTNKRNQQQSMYICVTQRQNNEKQQTRTKPTTIGQFCCHLSAVSQHTHETMCTRNVDLSGYLVLQHHTAVPETLVLSTLVLPEQYPYCTRNIDRKYSSIARIIPISYLKRWPQVL